MVLPCAALAVALAVALVAGLGTLLSSAEAGAAWRAAAAAPYLEAEPEPEPPAAAPGAALPSSYRVLEAQTQRLRVRTAIPLSEVPQCTSTEGLDCSPLAVGPGTRAWCAASPASAPSGCCGLNS